MGGRLLAIIENVPAKTILYTGDNAAFFLDGINGTLSFDNVRMSTKTRIDDVPDLIKNNIIRYAIFDGPATGNNGYGVEHIGRVRVTLARRFSGMPMRRVEFFTDYDYDFFGCGEGEF